MASISEKLELKVVGTRPIRPDGVDKVTGRANFGADMKMPGMLHGRIKRSPHPHARPPPPRLNPTSSISM